MDRWLKFDYSTSWYMHKPESLLENETHRNLRDFKIQTDSLTPARRPDFVMITQNISICQMVEFTVPTDHRVKKKKRRKRDANTCERIKNIWNMKRTVIQSVIGALWTILKRSVRWGWKWWTFEVDRRLFKLQPCYDRREHWEDSWRHVEICYHSDSSKKLTANDGVNNWREKMMI